MCESRERKEGQSGEENETVNPRGELETGLDQVQEKCPLRREFSSIIRITRVTRASRPGCGRSCRSGRRLGHQCLC